MQNLKSPEPPKSPKTLTEKIFSRKLGREVAPGEIVECPVDFAMFPEGSFKMAMDALSELGKPVAHPDKVAVIFDHYCPPNTIQTAEVQAAARRLAKKSKIKNFFECGSGVCHQVFCEQGFARPGSIIVGGDSHTTTYGAFGAFSTGMGATDMAMVLATGKTWFKIPETYKVSFQLSDGIIGKSCQKRSDNSKLKTDNLPRGIYAKDLALAMLKEIGADGAIYKALEFELLSDLLSDDTKHVGLSIDTKHVGLSIESRMTICNMAVECGAKNGIFAPDTKVAKYLRAAGAGGAGTTKLTADKGAQYEKTFEIPVPDSPLVACPNSPDNVKTVADVEGVELDQVFIGSCTNGRIEDLEAAAQVFAAAKKRSGMLEVGCWKWDVGNGKVKARTIIGPASRAVYLEALERGWIDTFVRAGCMIITPGCGPCLGAHSGILASGETGLATTNRNFVGRMGSPESKLYLSSPATAAASAIEGKIADPRRFL